MSYRNKCKRRKETTRRVSYKEEAPATNWRVFVTFLWWLRHGPNTSAQFWHYRVYRRGFKGRHNNPARFRMFKPHPKPPTTFRRV